MSQFLEPGIFYKCRNGSIVRCIGPSEETPDYFIVEQVMWTNSNTHRNFYYRVDKNGRVSHTRAYDEDVMERLDTPAEVTMKTEPDKVSADKFDAGKPDLSLLPVTFLEQVALALMYGEQKYNRYNYRKGFLSFRLVAAAMRHLTNWYWRRDCDEESGLSHLAHAGACIAMLLDCQQLGTLDESDRPAKMA